MEERISGWLARVPGYTGYRSKEAQRDEDKQLRVAIAADLNSIVSQMTRFGAELAAKREFTHISAVETALADTRHLADRIRNASYGYGGIFTDRPIDDTALTQLRQFDIALQREVIALKAKATAATTSDGLTGFREALREISALFDSRSDVVEQGRPTTDQTTLALLDRPVAATASPLLDVAVGDAISVLGDNYTVDASISLVYNDARIKLIRIADDKQVGERWLLGSSSIEVWPSADLVETSGTTSLVPLNTPGGGSPAKMSVEGPQGSGTDVPVTYGFTQTDDSAINLEINIGGERRAFTGKILNDIDVEIYGSTKSTK